MPSVRTITDTLRLHSQLITGIGGNNLLGIATEEMPYASSRCFWGCSQCFAKFHWHNPLLDAECHFETQNLTWPQLSVSEYTLLPIEQIAAHSL
jgi:hypothetical protein